MSLKATLHMGISAGSQQYGRPGTCRRDAGLKWPGPAALCTEQGRGQLLPGSPHGRLGNIICIVPLRSGCFNPTLEISWIVRVPLYRNQSDKRGSDMSKSADHLGPPREAILSGAARSTVS